MKKKDVSSSGTSPNEFFTKLAWKAIWTKPTPSDPNPYYLPNVIKNGISKDGIKVDPLGNLQLGNVPSSGSFQLMKSHDLAHWLPVKTGYVGIKFSDVTVSDIFNITDGGLTYKDVPGQPSKGDITAKINTPAINITGKYVVVATGLAQCAADAASIIPSFKDNADAVDASSSPTPDQMLDAARAQRTKLWQTQNGGLFMDKFYDHNEVYNYAFQNSLGLQNSWSSSTNQHFMASTYGSSQDQSKTAPPLNTGKAPDGTEYNTNAFNQKLAVAAACTFFYSNPPAGTNITKQQFLNGALAAAKFTGTVDKTGNSPSATQGMNFHEVYSTVQAGDPTLLDEMDDAMAMAKHGDWGYPEFVEALSEEEAAYLDSMGFDLTGKNAQKMLAAQDASATLIQGSCTINISSGTLTLGAELDFQTSPTLKATATVNSFTSDMKVNKVDIDNFNAWGGLPSIATALINAYNNSGQIASLMQDKINGELSSSKVKDYIGGWLNKTLQKVFGDF